MSEKYYTKHAVLADKLIGTPCPQAIEQIKNWFSERDYSFIPEIDATNFIREIEIRLRILQTLTFGQLYVSSPDGSEMLIWKHSCRAGNAKLTSLSRDEANPRGSYVSVEKAANLTMRHELAEHYREQQTDIPDTATPSEIKAYTKQNQIMLNRHEYLCPIELGGKQLLLSVDLSISDKTILDEIAILLPKIREMTGVAQPESAKQARNNKSLSPFINQYALQYLDLLIYRIQPEMTTSETRAYRDGSTAFLRPDSRHLWDLTDPQIAEIIAPIDLDGETIKGWRKDTYEKKLLNSEYMEALLRNARKEHLV
ncbi:DUF6387 family protein [Vibrio parahaemolyticus]|uniref:DUF6387 family protein n=1 Tax=Vibrio parahaemolyticus TaxID=670 RepID=UPI0003FDDDFB|nr:DUF6387 family protein [Vibrio parahaemolyticus]